MAMAMAMMQIGKMWMAMPKWSVLVGVGMWLTNWIVRPMFVLMMFIMAMAMGMFERFVEVFVFMPLCDMKIDANAHQDGRPDQLHSYRIAQYCEGDEGANEWSGRKVGAGAGGSKMPQRQNEQHQAYPIAKQADDASASDRRNGGKTGASTKRKRQVDRTGHQPLDHRDLHRVC